MRDSSVPYIDPKRARRTTAAQRQARAQKFAERAAADARANRYRLIVHGIIISLGVWAFRKTDIHSDDPFESVTLVMLDMVFCIYLLLLVFIEVWNRSTR